MANQANNNGDNKTCIDYFLQDLCKKFYREDIFTFETFPVSMNNIQKPLDKLTRDQKNLLISSVQDIGNYNNEYALLGIKYISLKSQSNDILNRQNYKDYIRLAKDGYLQKKIIVLFVLKYLMILAQLYLTFFVIYPRHRCIYEHIADENENFWYCAQKKCKVKKIEIFEDYTFRLRIIYCIYNFIFFVVEMKVIINLERFKANIFFVVILQLVKYFTSGLLIYYTFVEKNICEISKIDKNIFYVKNDDLAKIELTLDIINFFIN